MKFDFIIGNPPFQEETADTSDKPIYNDFMDGAFSIADKVELITPGRFLFNAGKTPKAWNDKMLSDPHLKVLYYEQDAKKVFPSATFSGGVSITYHDVNMNFDEIGVFSQYEELRAIREKMSGFVSDDNITSIIYLQNRFNLNALYYDYPEYKAYIGSDGKEKRIVTNVFGKLDVFTSEKKSDDDVRILGVINGERKFLWINSKYIEDNGNLNRWKVVVSQANGASGTIGDSPARIISMPMICEPQTGYSQTFFGFGSFQTKDEANACLKYIKSKFVRALLGILKITQHNPPDRWILIPTQDFTSASDIDWSKSVSEIDQQLYKKYGLNDDEIAFIESHVKEMK